ncbi:unnamed protein product [Protopolystoma xenopodis]|uniref:Uncharacterized protein n=1 Tax=Protopolystoma xenopodis TaxID=117903 RepID=A0A3S5A9P7_9PLAT|nr:unnamed protein product [Protopolystoma xenopodis]
MSSPVIRSAVSGVLHSSFGYSTHPNTSQNLSCLFGFPGHQSLGESAHRLSNAFAGLPGAPSLDQSHNLSK